MKPSGPTDGNKRWVHLVEAVRATERAVALYPSDPKRYVSLGNFLADLGREPAD